MAYLGSGKYGVLEKYILYIEPLGFAYSQV